MIYLHVLQVSAASVAPARCLNLQEFQSKKLMQESNVNVQDFRVADSVGDAEEIAKSFSKYGSWKQDIRCA